MKSISRHRVLGLSAALLFFLGQASFAKTFIVYVGSDGDNFSPQTITIEPGDKIEWNWDSSFHSHHLWYTWKSIRYVGFRCPSNRLQIYLRV